MTRTRTLTTPRRPVLAPGLRAFAPVPGEIQIGLTPGHRLRLPDSAPLRRILAVLNRGEAPRDAPSTRRVLAELAPVLRDGDTLLHPGIAAGDVAAATLRHPADAAERLRRRSRQRVRVVGDLADELDLVGLARRCGLPTVPADDARPTVVVVLVRGEPDRALLDPLLRGGVPHLLIRSVESEIVLGPFVVPEQTACLRCVDAHLAQRDRTAGPGLVDYLRSVRRDGVAEPLDSSAAAIATGWAVADLIRFAEGDRPTTWSATLTLGAGPAVAEPVAWLRHPRCGCSWGLVGDSAASVTMEV